MNRFYSNNNVNPIQAAEKSNRIDVKWSSHDISRMNYGSSIIGAITPIDCFRTVPGETVSLDYDILLKLRNPISTQLWSGMRVMVRAFYNRDSDLWEGADNHYTKGRSGQIALQEPYINSNGSLYVSEDGADAVPYIFHKPCSLQDYIGHKSGLTYNSTDGVSLSSIKQIEGTLNANTTAIYLSTSGKEPSALPYVQYQRYCRDYEFNKNLLKDNKHWFPDNESHFILPYDCSSASLRCLDYDYPYTGNADYPATTSDASTFVSVDGEFFVPSNDNDDNNSPVCLAALHFHQFRGNRFNTGLPFPDLVRGDIPTITISDITGYADFTDAVNSGSEPSGLLDVQLDYTNAELYPSSTSANSDLISALNKNTLTGVSSASVTMSALTELNAWTIFKQKMAMTDGDYDSMVKAQYNRDPHKRNHSATIIGSSYQDVLFSDVLNTAKTDDVPLGTLGAQAISSGSHNFGSFTSPDYGRIMVVMTILPDTVTISGEQRELMSHSQEEEYFPILNRLAPQPILAYELNRPSADSSVDMDVIAYEERFSERKSRDNVACGLVGLPYTNNAGTSFNNLQDSDFLMKRDFSAGSEINNAMVTLSPGNVDTSAFAVPEDIPFNFSVGCRVKRVHSPMPAYSLPIDGLAQV